jgi:uncharacterized DUF497 family protein
MARWRRHRFEPILRGARGVVEGDLEWDADKAESNAARHGITFEEAGTVFADPRMALFDDGSGRGRLLAVGFSVQGRLLAVVHVPTGERERIVSARTATARERLLYAEGDEG